MLLKGQCDPPTKKMRLTFVVVKREAFYDLDQNSFSGQNYSLLD